MIQNLQEIGIEKLRMWLRFPWYVLKLKGTAFFVIIHPIRMKSKCLEETILFIETTFHEMLLELKAAHMSLSALAPTRRPAYSDVKKLKEGSTENATLHQTPNVVGRLDK